jgi:dimethylamine/trimethylamine dehydrogenase
MRDPKYDILFEPVKLGPVTARNRFFQVPHCNGMGHEAPRALAGMRGVKAEGGWAVVSTEEVTIHWTGDVAPYREGRLWDDRDVPALRLMTDAVHEHGALAAIELTHNGMIAANLYSREAPISVGHQVNMYNYAPLQARAMDKNDIRAYRRWHRDAALRAKRAGFDIVYVYAGHDISLAMHFLQKRRNDRTDEYGGSFENRVRLLRELIEDTKEAVGDRCAIALRFAVDELMGEGGITASGEGREVVERLAELPDLWDVNVSTWMNDSATSRFAGEGFQESFVSFVKKVTTKPVVGVGRFTSPDTMVSQIKRGVLDFIGAARPSIADPFLPKKIESGEIDDIRECIGCNVCVSGDLSLTPIRCTQNPTMGEEWRKGWHPERVPSASSAARFLVVGAGPAGLEAARVLGKRGHEVHLSESRTVLGGRVTQESALPGLAAWARVRDYRVGQLRKMQNVSIYLDSTLTPEQVLEFDSDHVICATGSRWRRDGVGRAHTAAIPGFELPAVCTPDDLMNGRELRGRVVVFDDDHYYIAGVLAERLCEWGCAVTFVTPASMAAAWTEKTLEQWPIQRRLLELGVTVITSHDVVGFDGTKVTLSCIYSQREVSVAAESVLTVTSRLPDQELYDALLKRVDTNAGPKVSCIGDAWAPSTIAAAVYAGHQIGREHDMALSSEVPFKRELPIYLG